MRILVTGAAGFIGSHTCEALVANHDVVGIDNFDDYYSAVIKRRNLRHLAEDSRFSFKELDILENSSLDDLGRLTRPDIVIHLAGRAGVRPSVQHPHRYIETNITGTLNVLQMCSKWGVEKLMFASSSSVYGGSFNGPCRESQSVSPLNVYAASKVAGEALCHSFSHLFGITTVCLRFFTVYGPRQRPDMAIAKFVGSIKASQPIELRGGANSARDYTYVGDIVNGIVRLIEAKLPTNAEVFNLGSSRPVLLSELVEELGCQLGVRPILRQVPLPKEEVEVTHADISKARNCIGYLPGTSLSEGIAKYVNWIENDQKFRIASAV